MKKKYLLLFLISFFALNHLNAQVADTVGAGNSLNFVGALNSGIDLGDVYNSLTFPFTFEAWIYPTALQTYTNCGIFSTDYDSTNYVGAWVFVNTSASGAPLPGSFSVEFGDASGAGIGDRHGFSTISPLPLNQWLHVAAVCNSVTNVELYVNGVLTPQTPTLGASSNTTFTHSGNHANIGRANVGKATSMQIDEVHLWNIALSQTEIRNDMCKKINPNTDGLIGLWRMDEPDSATTIHDYSSTGANGILMGTVGHQVSGAAIGNNSNYLYTLAWNGQHVSLIALNTDSFVVNNVMGNPLGIQVYAVNASPAHTTGLDLVPSSYFGVFVVDTSTLNLNSLSYRAVYNYTYADSLVTPFNRSLSQIMVRPNAATANADWISSGGTLDTAAYGITMDNEYATTQEYALTSQKVTGINPVQSNTNQLSIYPNPASNQLTIISKQSIKNISFTNILGQPVYKSSTNDLNENKQTLGVNILPDGLYFISITTTTAVVTEKIVVSR